MLLAQPHPGHQQGILVVLGMPDHGCLHDPVVPAAFRPVPSDQDVALDRVWASFDGNSFRSDDRRCERLQNRRRLRHVRRQTHPHDNAPRTKGSEYDTTLERFELGYTGSGWTPEAFGTGFQPPASHIAGWWSEGRQTVSTVAPFLSASTTGSHTFRPNANIPDAVSVPVGTHSDNPSRGSRESRPATNAVSPNNHKPSASDWKLRQEPTIRGSIPLKQDHPRGGVSETKGHSERSASPARLDTAPGVLRGTEQTPGASHSRSYTRHSIQIAPRALPRPERVRLQADDGCTPDLPAVVRTSPGHSCASQTRNPPDRQTGCANAAFLIPMRRAGDSRRGGRWRAMEKQAAARQFSHDALRYCVDALPAHSRISKSVSRARLGGPRAATPNDNMPSVLGSEHDRGWFACRSKSIGSRLK